MEPCVDFGPFLAEFIQEFGCDAQALEYISIMLQSKFDIPFEHPKQHIQRFFQKVSKKRPELATQISSLVDDVENSGLCNASELVAFFIFFGSARKGIRREQKKKRLNILNEVASNSSNSTKSTPKNVRFLDTEVRSTPVLNGRGKNESVLSEDIIMADILSALVGIEGRYIVLVSHDCFEVSPHCAIDDVLYSQLLNVLKICSLYKNLQRLTLCTSADLMIQSFYGAIPEVLTEYSEIVSALYSKFTNCSSSISPLQISLALDEWQLVMEQFRLVSRNNFLEKCSGMAAVNLIYGLYCRCATESLGKRILKKMLKCMLGVFHRCLLQWILYGTLDESTQWMITVQREGYSSNPWSTKYEIFDAAVPEIFKNFPKLTKKILRVGRSVALLNSLGVKDNYFAERKRILESLDSLDIYLFIKETNKFSTVINRLYERTNAEVMIEVVGNYLIRDHLDIVHKHFFLIDECFAHCFFQQLCEVANDDLIKLDSKRACHAFTEAVFVCSSFPPLLKQHGHLEATCGVMESNGKVIPSPRDEKGYPTVRLRYVTKHPVSIVLDERSLDRYNKIFEFIWQVVSIDFRLSDAIEVHERLFADVLFKWEEMVKICRLFSAVFVRMTYYISIVRTYINTVIEQCSKKFASRFDSPSCGDLFKLVGAHRFFLSSIIEQLFLDDSGKNVRTAIIATLDAVKDGILEYEKFEHELRVLFDSAPSEFFNAGDPTFCEVDDTKAFEFEERRIELKTSFSALLNIYKPLTKNTYARFELLAKDVISGLENMDKSFPCLLLQHLRFGKFS
uniref:Gamma-tubulin complex component n=1 Tax=Syphacia muris TaxID=451379 RepID=A0A0N5ATV8_9BILA